MVCSYTHCNIFTEASIQNFELSQLGSIDNIYTHIHQTDVQLLLPFLLENAELVFRSFCRAYDSGCGQVNPLMWYEFRFVVLIARVHFVASFVRRL